MEHGTTIPRPTEAELELLQILWEKQPATVREIHDALNQDRPSGYTTVLQMLQIMTTNGLVVSDEANRAHEYRAALSQRLFAGSAAQLALQALSMEPATENELAEIRALVEHKRYADSSDQRPTRGS